MTHRLTYLELPASNLEQSARFYADIIGWKLDVRSPGDIRFSDEAAQVIGRFVRGRAATSQPGILPYFSVDDVQAAISRLATSGGEVETPRYREGDLWVARLRDPSGNVIGIWQFAA